MKLTSRLLLFSAASVSLIFAACGGRNSSAPNNEAENGQNQNVSAPPNQRAAQTSGFVYTADERGNSISRINLADNQVQKFRISVSPHNVQISRDGQMLLAVGAPANGGGHSHGAESEKHDDGGIKSGEHGDEHGGALGKLLIFDAAKIGVDQPSEIEVGRHPAHVVVDSQGKFIYVSNSEDDTVSVVDAAQKKVVNTVKTGKFPHGLRISPDGREIYVANTGDGTVSVIGTSEQKEIARIPVGKAPVQVGFTPDGSRVFVSLRDENSVAVIDAKTRRKIASLSVGNQPIQMFATPDGRFVYVANQGTEDAPDNRVSVIDAQNNTVVATITAGKGTHGVVASDDGSRVFVTDTFDDTVSMIDTATQKVVGTISVGDAPNGITFGKAL